MRYTLTVEGKPPPLLPPVTERPEADALKLPEVIKLGSDKGGGLAGIRGSRKKTKGGGLQFTFTNSQFPERPPVIVNALPTD